MKVRLTAHLPKEDSDCFAHSIQAIRITKDGEDFDGLLRNIFQRIGTCTAGSADSGAQQYGCALAFSRTQIFSRPACHNAGALLGLDLHLVSFRIRDDLIPKWHISRLVSSAGD